MRSKAIPRKRKVKPLEYGVEKQNAGIASNSEEQDSGQVKKSTKVALPLLQQSGKSKNKGRKQKRLNSKKSNSKKRKLNQEVTNKQMTPIQDSGGLNLEQPPNGVKENTFELAEERKDFLLPSPSFFPSDRTSPVLQQQVQPEFNSILANHLQVVLNRIKTQQALQQTSEFSMTAPFEQPENNIVSLRGKGISQSRTGEKQLEITEEPFQSLQRKRTKTCKQKVKVIDRLFGPGTAQTTKCKIDIPDADIAVGCSEQRKGPVKESTIKAVRVKLLSNRISGNTGKKGKSLNISKTVSAKGSILDILERKQGNAVTERNAQVVQPLIDSPGCQCFQCHQILQAITSNRRNLSQSVMSTSGLSGIKPAQPLQKALAFSTKKTCEQPQNNFVSLGGEEISLAREIVSDFEQESIQRHPEQEEMIVRSILKATETEEQNLIPVTAQEYNDEIDKPGVLTALLRPWYESIKPPTFLYYLKKGTAENYVEQDKGQVKQSTKDALRRKVQSNINASKKGKYRKRLNTNKNKAMSPIKKSKRLTWKEEVEDYKLPHPCFQMNAAEQAKMTLDIKNQSKVFRQIPAIPKEQTLKIGQTKTFSTFEDIPVQMMADVDAGKGGNLPDFSKLFERWTGY